MRLFSGNLISWVENLAELLAPTYNLEKFMAKMYGIYFNNEILVYIPKIPKFSWESDLVCRTKPDLTEWLVPLQNCFKNPNSQTVKQYSTLLIRFYYI